MEAFNPRPEVLRNTSTNRFLQLLHDVMGKGLCLSLLLDLTVCVGMPTTQHSIFSKLELLSKVKELKRKLSVTEDDICHIEMETKGQVSSSQWFETRGFRLTASFFGWIRQLQLSTPDNLVLTILGVKTVSGPALSYGRYMEAIALKAYVKYQHANGHPDLIATTTGVIISHTHPFLAASPDACVYNSEKSFTHMATLKLNAHTSIKIPLPL